MSALGSCPACKGPLAANAAACPACGYKRSMPVALSVAVKIAVAIGLFVVIWYGGKWAIDVAFPRP